MWYADDDALESIAIGAGILGTGGGGNPYTGKLRTKQVLKKNGPMGVIPLDDVEDDARVVCVGGIGATTVGVEKIRGLESYHALRAIEAYSKSQATALISNEIGGSNSFEAMIAASSAGLNVVDGDGMGRAFPELQMKTFFIYGAPYVPMSLCDEKGNVMYITEAFNAKWVERLARAATVQMGCVAAYAVTPMSGAQVKRSAVPGTLSLTRRIGDAVREARREHRDPVAAILETHAGKVLFQGKISDVERRTTGGFARGHVSMEGLDEFSGERLEIEFQNENLVARQDGEVLAIVPDLICIVEAETAEPITTEMLRYGFRVKVLGFPAPEQLTTPEALAVVGPHAFGYDLKFSPISI